MKKTSLTGYGGSCVPTAVAERWSSSPVEKLPCWPRKSGPSMSWSPIHGCRAWMGPNCWATSETSFRVLRASFYLDIPSRLWLHELPRSLFAYWQDPATQWNSKTPSNASARCRTCFCTPSLRRVIGGMSELKDLEALGVLEPFPGRGRECSKHSSSTRDGVGFCRCNPRRPRAFSCQL
jgi:hypothetical protein